MAIGADRGAVLGMVLRQGLGLSLIGVAVGLVAAAAVSRGLSAMMEGVVPADPMALAVVPASLLAVTALAAFVPAWRAARVDPIRALRCE